MTQLISHTPKPTSMNDERSVHEKYTLKIVPTSSTRMTKVIEVRLAFNGSKLTAHDERLVEDFMDNIRTIGSAEIIKEGVINKSFSEWTTSDLKRATWLDE